MSKVAVGVVAYLKTTEEPTFVLAVETKEVPFKGLCGTVVTVRRPVDTKEEGIQHVIEDFFIEELETSSEKQDRMFKEMNEINSRFKAKSGGSDDGPDGFKSFN